MTFKSNGNDNSDLIRSTAVFRIISLQRNVVKHFFKSFSIKKFESEKCYLSERFSECVLQWQIILQNMPRFSLISNARPWKMYWLEMFGQRNDNLNQPQANKILHLRHQYS